MLSDLLFVLELIVVDDDLKMLEVELYTRAGYKCVCLNCRSLLPSTIGLFGWPMYPQPLVYYPKKCGCPLDFVGIFCLL